MRMGLFKTRLEKYGVSNDDMEYKLTSMYQEIIHVQPQPLPIHYCLYKLRELLEYTITSPIKFELWGEQKWLECDRLWKVICDENGWTFIPSC